MSGKKYESNWQKKEQNTNEQTVKTRNENEHYERQKYTITTNQAMSGNQKVRNTIVTTNESEGENTRTIGKKRTKVTTSKRQKARNNERTSGKKYESNRQKKNEM